MATNCASDTESRPTEESFIYLKILTEEDKHVSNSESVGREISSKYFYAENIKCLASDRLCFDVQHDVSEKMIITRQATEKNAQNKAIGRPTIKNPRLNAACTSKQTEPTSKFAMPKVEGRKAPGANRILPLITSVWEDNDVHRKRQKPPKTGVERRNSKGKLSILTKKCIQGNSSGEEEEGDWLEKWDFDDLGGSIYRAYTDFFMAEEVGESREDCICSECGEEFLTATHVAHHLEFSHNKGAIKLYQCFVCRRKRYPSLPQLNQHLSEAHGIPRPQLTCRTCFMELAGESEAKAHSRKHQTPYKCSRCPLSHPQNGHGVSVPRFATHFLLSEHLREVHLPLERPFLCTICGRHFVYEFVRDLHLWRRHRSHSLICPEVRNRPSSAQNTNLLGLNYFSDSIPTSTSAVSNASSSNVLEDQDGGFAVARVSWVNDTQFTSCEQNQEFPNPTEKTCKKLSENTQVLLQKNSVCCSKSIYMFPDDVSLLRHVFKIHEKQVRLQLLKWAKEADREDTLFEKLWNLYSKISSKDTDLRISVNKEKTATSDVPKQVNMEMVINSGRISLNPCRSCKQSDNHHLNKELNKIHALSNNDATIEFSHPINNQCDCSNNKTIISNGDVLSTTFLDGKNQTSQYSAIVPAVGSSVPSSSTACFYKKQCMESTLSSSENVSNSSAVNATIQPLYTSPQKTIPQPSSSEFSIENMQISKEILDGVKSCLTDIVDAVCDVFDEGSCIKESKNIPSHVHPQKILSVRCLLCRYLASSALALERHRRRRHFRNKHCPFCSLACLSVEAVWRHVSETHLNSSVKEVNGFISKEGPKEAEESSQSQKQVQSSSGLRCPVCKKIFSSRGKCNSHQETVHKMEVVSRPLKCAICSKKFQFQKALERHQLLHRQDDVENGDQTLYSCPHCEQTFLRPGFLERHIASHFEVVRKEGKEKAANGPFGHMCMSCSRRLPTRAKLKIHMRTSHPPSHLRQRFVCSQCPVKCNTASGLRVHMRVHTGERPYQCTKCSMSFKRKTALRKHVAAVHAIPSESQSNGLGTFLQCPDCPSLFRDRSNLVRHFLQVHRGLRRFVCGLCGAKYAQNQDLRRHLKASHSVDAPRIIGSDRRSADQIYVVPPVMDDLHGDHSLVAKIRAIIEEEEQKLNEDNLPTFTETPQQLHLHIHKEPIGNVEAVSKLNKETKVCNVTNQDSADPMGFVSDVRKSTEVMHDDEFVSGKKSIKTKAAEQGVFLKVDKELLESSKVCSVVEKNGKDIESKNSTNSQRNLILDALLSSQISADAVQLQNNLSYLEQGLQLNQVFNTNYPGSKRYENESSETAEMNIIMTTELPIHATDSKGGHVESSRNSEGKDLMITDGTKGEEDLIIKKKKLVSGTFVCCHCGKEFLDATRLERHSKIHSDLKPHACSICGKSFLEKYNLKVHMRAHTGERPYKCEICGKSMRYLKEIADHRRMHMGERPHVCEICSRAFLRLRDLQRHLQIHLNVKKHHCPVCNKAFSRLDHLRTVHMRVHEPRRSSDSKTSDKARKSGPNETGLQVNLDKNLGGTCHSIKNEFFQCEKCSKKFSTRAKLEKHLVLHSGQKAYKCSSCGRSFALASYLSAHQKTHEKQQTYLQCPKCPRRFVSQETLSVHEEKFHQRIEKMKKYQSLEQNVKAGRSKDLNLDICDEERFFMTRTGEFDVNLDLEEEMNIQEVLFDPTSLSDAEKNNTFVYLHVISDDLQLSNENTLTE